MATTPKLGTTLIQVCTNGNASEARKILAEVKKERKPSALEIRHSSTQFTPLLTAVFHDRADIVDLLLQAGADIYAITSVQKMNTPLHVAAYYGHSKVLKVLLAHKVDLFRLNSDGLLALDLARMKSHTNCARLLLRKVEIYKGRVEYMSSAGLNPWKPCFARLLQTINNKTGTPMSELALHADRDDTCPFKVIVFDPLTTIFLSHEASPTSSGVEVSLSSQVCSYNYKSTLFSRDPSVQASKSKVTPGQFVMKVDSQSEAQRWVNIVSSLKSATSHTGSGMSSPNDENDFLQSARSRGQLSSLPPPPLADYTTPPPLGRPPSYDEVLALRRHQSTFYCRTCRRPSPSAVDKCQVCLKNEHLHVSLDRLNLSSRSLPSEPSAPSPALPSLPPMPASAPELEPSTSNDSSNECVICMDEARNAVCIPCPHLSSCVDCLGAASHCPICRTAIQSVVKVYTA